MTSETRTRSYDRNQTEKGIDKARRRSKSVLNKIIRDYVKAEIAGDDIVSASDATVAKRIFTIIKRDHSDLFYCNIENIVLDNIHRQYKKVISSDKDVRALLKHNTPEEVFNLVESKKGREELSNIWILAASRRDGYENEHIRLIKASWLDIEAQRASLEKGVRDSAESFDRYIEFSTRLKAIGMDKNLEMTLEEAAEIYNNAKETV